MPNGPHGQDCDCTADDTILKAGTLTAATLVLQIEQDIPEDNLKAIFNSLGPILELLGLTPVAARLSETLAAKIMGSRHEDSPILAILKNMAKSMTEEKEMQEATPHA